jgi:hypothetical protein
VQAQLGRHVLGKLSIAQQQKRLRTLPLTPVLASLDNTVGAASDLSQQLAVLCEPWRCLLS